MSFSSVAPPQYRLLSTSVGERSRHGLVAVVAPGEGVERAEVTFNLFREWGVEISPSAATNLYCGEADASIVESLAASARDHTDLGVPARVGKLATLVRRDAIDHEFLEQHTTGLAEVKDALPVQAWRSCLGEAQQVFEIGQCRRLQDESRGHLKGNVFSRACQEVSEALLERDGGSRSHLCSDGCSEGVY